MRADSYLASNGYCESRSRAQASIEGGLVFVNGVPVTKCSFDIKDGDKVELKGQIIPYVGRGGFKLAGALDSFGLSPKGLTCVDIGASTGGFTDVLLQRGAFRVYAVDCGRGQLHPSLVSDKRVVNIEGFNARELSSQTLGQECDMAVMDVSFISQTLLLEAVKKTLAENGIFVTLIKPQFEVGREHIGKGGIVKDRAIHREAIRKVVLCASENGFTLMGLDVSPISGGDGNREYLAFFRAGRHSGITADAAFLKRLTEK
jgi:23S rRNA (cytidine1920-2'-O)/16S rRNA (cytidine1409-2'-O)-methyltransferase